MDDHCPECGAAEPYWDARMADPDRLSVENAILKLENASLKINLKTAYSELKKADQILAAGK